MFQDVEDKFSIEGNIQFFAVHVAGDVVFDGTVIGMLAHQFNLALADEEVDDIILSIFGYDGSSFHSACKFGAIDFGDTFKVRRDDAAVIGEVPFDEARTDVDVAELNGQVVADCRDFDGLRNIRRQLTRNFRQETAGDNGLERIIHRFIEGRLFQSQK